MRRILAIMFVGVSIAVPGAIAFAAGDPGKDTVDHQKFPEPTFAQAQTTSAGTTAGPSNQLPVWVHLRHENIGN
jgi:hypothetical protein